MSSNHASLDAAAAHRKARLAKLASLKRKQPEAEITPDTVEASEQDGEPALKTDAYLSGRNYDTQTRGPRLGFENAPSSNVTTLEQQADLVAATAAEQAAKDEAAAEKGIDLFKLQPKKPNWDLKRVLHEKMKILDVRTQNAIAQLVRERIESAKSEARSKGRGVVSKDEGQDEEIGIEGAALIHGVHAREQEEKEDEMRERELDEADGILWKHPRATRFSL